jgi:hypothetical protein
MKIAPIVSMAVGIQYPSARRPGDAFDRASAITDARDDTYHPAAATHNINSAAFSAEGPFNSYSDEAKNSACRLQPACLHLTKRHAG